jgi:hypothetical protein
MTPLQIMGGQNSPMISDSPDQHGFVMMGTQTLFLDHLAMFPMANHRYQLIFRATLPQNVITQYAVDRARNPSVEYILGNTKADLVSLPELHTGGRTSFLADIFRGAPEDPNTTPPLIHNVLVEIKQIVTFRPFDDLFSYPAFLTYILYGEGTEAHMSHYMSRDPDFQQCLDLAGCPEWLSQLDLQSGVTINFLALPAGETPCTSPFAASTYAVSLRGQPISGATVQIGPTYWFDTQALGSQP